MIQKEDQSHQLPALGIDVGATLAKLAVREPSGELSCGFLPAGATDAVVRRAEALRPATIGVTGCGGGGLASHLQHSRLSRFVEFEAWGEGASILLERQREATREPYLLVSLGTGTSMLRVAGRRVERLGGTALGGGTVLGLGVALTGCKGHEELCRLAESGRRGGVDLLVSDIYPPGEIALPGEVTASSFGNLARWLSPGGDQRAEATDDESRRRDLAAAVMGLVGENVALISCGLAAAAGIDRIVYGGATLLNNPALVAVLTGVTAAMGRRPVVLEEGGYAGAVGALAMAARAEAERQT